MEEETRRRPAWKVDVHVGGWHVFGRQGSLGGGRSGEPECRVAHKKGPEEDSERNMGTKQLGDDRGGSVA